MELEQVKPADQLEGNRGARRKLLAGLGVGGLAALGLMQSREAKATTNWIDTDWIWQLPNGTQIMKLNSGSLGNLECLTGGFRSTTSTARGLNIDQAVSANVEGATYFNRINVQETINSYVVDARVFMNAFSIAHTLGGTSNSAGRNSLEVTLSKVAPTLSDAAVQPYHGNPNPPIVPIRDYVAAAFVAEATAGDTGTSTAPKGALFAMNPVAELKNGATYYLGVHCQENNLVCETGSSVYYKAGITIVAQSTDRVQGSAYDAALSISSVETSAQGPGSGVPGVGWKTGILFSAANSAQPMHSSGTLLKTDGASTVANGIDLSSYWFTGSAVKTPNFDLNSWGCIEMGSGNANAPPYIDFHSASGPDFDSRILAIGGNGSAGGGALYLYATALMVMVPGGAMKQLIIGEPGSGADGNRRVTVAN